MNDSSKAVDGSQRVDPLLAVAPRLCDACGLPARRHTEPLVRCTRCRAGWFHDQDCQRRHHPLHRKTCHTNSMESTPAVVRVVARPAPTGNALVLSPSLTTLLPWSSSSSERRGAPLGVFKSLVPPVMVAACRHSRCLWCLSGLPPDGEGEDPGAGERRLLLYKVRNLIAAWACSPECERAVRAGPPSSTETSSRVAAALLRHERDAILRLHDSNHDPPMYLPTALLLFRLLVATCLMTTPRREGAKGHVNWDDHVSCLAERPILSGRDGQHCDDDEEEDAEGDADEESAHEEAVVRTVQGMCHALLIHQSSSDSFHSISSRAPDPYLVDPAKIAARQSLNHLRQLLRRIKANAFGIRCFEDDDRTTSTRNDGASASSHDIGIGIFHVAHFANHSCRPNAEAIYCLERGQLPRLSLQLLLLVPTVDRPPPAPHDEVTVSYVSDEVMGLPRRERTRRIYRQFGFGCDCTKCRSGE